MRHIVQTGIVFHGCQVMIEVEVGPDMNARHEIDYIIDEFKAWMQGAFGPKESK